MTKHQSCSTVEIAAMFGISQVAVRQAIRRGKLPARKIGNSWLVRIADARALWGK